MRRIRRSGKRTVSGYRRSSAAVLFFVVLAALFLFFHGKISSKEEITYESGYTVVKETAAGKEKIPMGEYLIGALAASVPDDLEPEACKAQAVVLRTNARWLAKERGGGQLPYEELCQISLTDEEMHEIWGADYEKQYGKLKAAVEDTEGQILCYNGAVVELPFFSVSAGKTRDANELSKTRNFPYLQSVDCGQDVFAANYKQEIIVSEKELNHRLQRIFKTEEEILWQDIELRKDSAGYITEAVWKETTVSGEIFRQELSLASSCFSIEEREDRLFVITKGIGHGLGMSLYTADKMAEEGKDHQEILLYFFAGCEITKM